MVKKFKMFNNLNFKKMENTEKNTKKVYNLIIVDESGSMSIIRNEAFFNNKSLKSVAFPDGVTEIQSQSFWNCSNLTSIYFRKLTAKDYCPNAATPLYDAIGKGISKLNAETEVNDNVLVTIITDGEENCSSEYNLKMVKTLIEKQKQLGWTFTLIGTDNLDVEGMAGSLAIDNHLEFTEDAESTMRMFARERKARARYMECASVGKVMEKGSYFNED